MLLSGFPRRVAAEDLARRNLDLLVSLARCCSTGSGRLLRGPRFNLLGQPQRARGPGRGRPVVTGSLANERGRAKTAEGSRACFSPASLGAWLPKIWRGVIFNFIGFAGAMLLDRIGPPAEGPPL